MIYSVGFGVVVLLAIGAGLFYLSRREATETKVIRIAYGEGAQVRRRFLDVMVLYGQRRNLDIRLIPTQSTDHTISMVDRHEADLGLIASVVEDRGARRLLEVLPLYMEPLQLLVRDSLHASVLSDFGQLRGKSIDMDSPSSATRLLASELLRFMGLADQAGRPLYRPIFIPQLKLTSTSEPLDLPDAIFQIAGVPSGTLRHHIVTNNYRLVPLPFGESFNLDKFREETPDVFDHPSLRLNKSFVEEATIPAFVYSVLPPVPPAAIRTISTRLLMIGSDQMGSDVVRNIVDLILSPEVSTFATPALTVDLLKTSFQFERHPGTDAYLRALEPVDVDGAFVAYGRGVEIWGLLITLYIGAAKGLKVWRQRKAKDVRKSVGDFMLEVLAVEADAGASCSDAERVSLDQRLTDIKKSAIELHLSDLLEDADVLPSLLTTVADTRTRIWGRTLITS